MPVAIPVACSGREQKAAVLVVRLAHNHAHRDRGLGGAAGNVGGPARHHRQLRDQFRPGPELSPQDRMADRRERCRTEMTTTGLGQAAAFACTGHHRRHAAPAIGPLTSTSPGWCRRISTPSMRWRVRRSRPPVVAGGCSSTALLFRGRCSCMFPAPLRPASRGLMPHIHLVAARQSWTSTVRRS